MNASVVDTPHLLLDDASATRIEKRPLPAGPAQKSISVLVPTRRRPAMFYRMLGSLFSLADTPNDIEVVAYIDDDDEETLALDTGPWNVSRIVGPRQPMGRLNAACYARASGDIIMLGNDDMIARTRGWDTRIRREAGRFSDKVYLLYPNDMYKGSKICTFPILSRVACNSIDDPFPAEYRGAFIDIHLMDIFKRLNGCGHQRIVYLDEVIFEHMHYRIGKSSFDATYLERDRFGDDRTFLALNDARDRAGLRLRSIISGQGPAIQGRPLPSRPADAWFLQLTWNVLRAGSLPFSWRIRLFMWMWLRLAYRTVNKHFFKSRT